MTENKIIKSFAKPAVEFDPTNQTHRKWFHEFLTTHTWGNCPVSFVIPSETGILHGVMQRKLLEYYTSKEFV